MAEAKSPSRPRRSKVATTRVPATIVAAEEPGPSSSPATTRSKRKAKDTEADNDDVSLAKGSNKLGHLLTNPKSKLTTMDISDVLNYENFICLSPNSQELLCALLPPTAFTTYQPTIDSTHPSRALDAPSSAEQDSMDNDTPVPSTSANAIDTTIEKSPATLDPAVFTSPFFLSAALTFQDHLYSGWLSGKSKEKVEQFEKGIRDGTLHAEWKDESWERDYPSVSRSRNKTGEFGLDLASLAKRSLLKEGDILLYKRTFTVPGVTVEKDLLIHSIDPRSHALNLLLQPGTIRSLPTPLLVVSPPEADPPTLMMESVMSSSELEEGVLVVDRRVSVRERYQAAASASADRNRASMRPPTSFGQSKPDEFDMPISALAAKSISIWRWREEMLNDIEMQMLMDRGGRERLGTVFYLRSA